MGDTLRERIARIVEAAQNEACALEVGTMVEGSTPRQWASQILALFEQEPVAWGGECSNCKRRLAVTNLADAECPSCGFDIQAVVPLIALPTKPTDESEVDEWGQFWHGPTPEDLPKVGDAHPMKEGENDG